MTFTFILFVKCRPNAIQIAAVDLKDAIETWATEVQPKLDGDLKEALADVKPEKLKDMNGVWCLFFQFPAIVYIVETNAPAGNDDLIDTLMGEGWN